MQQGRYSTQWSRRITDDWSRRPAMAFSSSSAASWMRCAVRPSCNRDTPEQRRDGRRWYQRARIAVSSTTFVDGVNGYSLWTSYVSSAAARLSAKERSSEVWPGELSRPTTSFR
jgi:hypothetical protein